MKPVLVTGGTGQVGWHVVRSLLARDAAVRCLVRRPEHLGLLAGLPVELAAGDVTDPGSLASACRGVGAVVHAAGVVSYRPENRALLERVNVEGTRALLDAAAGAGVARFVVTSSIAALGHVPPGEVGDEGSAFNWQGWDLAYQDSKHAQEALVLADRRLHTAAVCPGIVLGAGDVHGHGVRLLRPLAAAPPGATTVSVAHDVGEGHVLALERARAGERYVIGSWHGSFLDLLTRVAAVAGHGPPRRVAPEWLLVAFGAWTELTTPPEREPPLTRALARVSARNRQYTSRKAMEELGWRTSSLEDGVRAALDDLGRHATR